jgi:hypothetical protein
MTPPPGYEDRIPAAPLVDEPYPTAGSGERELTDDIARQAYRAPGGGPGV